MIAVRSDGEERKPIKDRGDGRAFGIKGSRRGLPLIGIFNEHLRDFSSRDKLPWLLNIYTRFSETFANGFPKESEFASLNEWEDSLIIQSKASVSLLGSVMLLGTALEKCFFM